MARDNVNDLLAFLTVARERSFTRHGGQDVSVSEAGRRRPGPATISDTRIAANPRPPSRYS